MIPSSGGLARTSQKSTSCIPRYVRNFTEAVRTLVKFLKLILSVSRFAKMSLKNAEFHMEHTWFVMIITVSSTSGVFHSSVQRSLAKSLLPDNLQKRV